MIINKKYYEKYFINLVKYLNWIKFPFLYYLPSLLKRDFRTDFVRTKKNYNFLSLRNFNKDISINENFFFRLLKFVLFLITLELLIKIQIMIFIMENYFKNLKKKKLNFQ